MKIIVAIWILMSACTSTPRGTPPATQASAAAADALVISGAVLSGQTNLWPRYDPALAASTRIELFLDGARSCLSVGPSDLEFRLLPVNGEGQILTSGRFSAKSDAIAVAPLMSGEYRWQVLAARNSHVYLDNVMEYHGQAPWMVTLKFPCAK